VPPVGRRCGGAVEAARGGVTGAFADTSVGGVASDNSGVASHGSRSAAAGAGLADHGSSTVAGAALPGRRRRRRCPRIDGRDRLGVVGVRAAYEHDHDQYEELRQGPTTARPEHIPPATTCHNREEHRRRWRFSSFTHGEVDNHDLEPVPGNGSASA
jgi:hypothetical protein